jgi:predicted RNA binding protein YcfA (HicA-like mRNA interferase family)
MPKLRRLTGKQVIDILKGFGFTVVRIRGSHHMLQRTVEDKTQTVTVPLHKNNPLAIGTLKSIYRQTAIYVNETELKTEFYADFVPDDDDAHDEADKPDEE